MLFIWIWLCHHGQHEQQSQLQEWPQDQQGKLKNGTVTEQRQNQEQQDGDVDNVVKQDKRCVEQQTKWDVIQRNGQENHPTLTLQEKTADNGNDTSKPI